jgi:hypothetical protein
MSSNTASGMSSIVGDPALLECASIVPDLNSMMPNWLGPEPPDNQFRWMACAAHPTICMDAETSAAVAHKREEHK